MYTSTVAQRFTANVKGVHLLFYSSFSRISDPDMAMSLNIIISFLSLHVHRITTPQVFPKPPTIVITNEIPQFPVGWSKNKKTAA